MRDAFELFELFEEEEKELKELMTKGAISTNDITDNKHKKQ